MGFCRAQRSSYDEAVTPFHSNPARIRILLANHQPIVRSGLRLLLEREPDFQIVAEAANGRKAIVLAEFKRPAVTLLEMQLPHLNGIAVAKELLSTPHSPKSHFRDSPHRSRVRD